MSELPVGLITEIRRFATHDGPGIRSTVYFKGCPLRCFWCANPEGLQPQRELYFFARRCQGHGACVAACPEHAVERAPTTQIDHSRCTLCLDCVAVCPQRCWQPVGREVTVAELVAALERDRPFYGADGGVTLCGGEPLVQPDFALALLRSCRERGLTTVLDTCGHAPPAVVDVVLPYVDLVLLDLKHMDPDAHCAGTGVDNALILANAARMARQTRVRVSLPLVPGFNDSADNLAASARFVRSLGVEAIDLLPLHNLGSERYRQLGLAPPVGCCPPSAAAIQTARQLIESLDVEVTVGRMM